jgi:hypothetical protein
VAALARIADADRAAAQVPGRARELEFCAQTLGCRVPRARHDGRIDAVFQRACNIALADGGMITLLAQNCANIPHGVRLTCSPRFDRLFRRGMPVRLSRDHIGFDDGAVVVLLGQTPTWTPALRPGMFDWRGGGAEVVRSVERLLRQRVADTRSDLLAATLDFDRGATPLAACAAEIVPRLSRCLRAADADEALRSLARIIGLGPGLTPAGDDFIVGWLAGVTIAARSHTQLGFLDAVCARLHALRQATTPVSWQHLDDARALTFSERLSDLAVAIAAGVPDDDLIAHIEAQLAVGATSGADAVAGLIVALLAACPGSQPRRQSHFS